MRIKAVLFDLHGTLAYVPSPFSDDNASDFLVSRGYEVYPQGWKAAWHYVGFIDYPKYGYRTWKSFLERVSYRFGIRLDLETLTKLAELYEEAGWRRYPDVQSAFAKAKEAGLKTAIITTIARFKFKKALKPIWDKIDLVVDGNTFHCEKSNPKIYLKALEILGVEPCQAVMVGDEIQLDILLPKGLGIKAVFLDREEKNAGCPHADAVVNNLNEAVETIIGKFGEETKNAERASNV
jgi:FMN phosphatase YigB (HAD superfamily)